MVSIETLKKELVKAHESRNLALNEVSEMKSTLTLGWTRPWLEELLEAFFVAAKCIWLLHLLAFSFNPVLGILRVDEKH
ncbi:hypothetical protein RD792_003216 [Penstemon davidsonii]|uniref:Uncharacterized protein n=1 Tax=Penstemon davidsonii TaxID=160366 RepID=A0ABR0DTW4_9LAMI|nr:hypothetical protein RD792_003216 [Penstemon davidsonii]